MENNGENSGPLTSLLVDCLMATNHIVCFVSDCIISTHTPLEGVNIRLYVNAVDFFNDV